MVLRTFNVHEKVHKKSSHFCKGYGLSMNKQMEMFMVSVIGEEPIAKQEYLKKLERIRKGEFISVKSFAGKYGL